MLQELTSVQQVAGERRRRWFFCQELDVVIWFDGDQPVGFQLAYDKLRGEHSFSWHLEKGYRHYLVDHGGDLETNRTPLLANTTTSFPADRIVPQFRALAAGMPADLANFVIEKMQAHAHV